MTKPRHHLFICQNQRAEDNPRGSCKQRGSAELLACFKQRIQERQLRNEIEVDGTTCVDTCAWGPVAVAYPDQDWYGKLSLNEVDSLLDSLLAAQPLKDKLVPDDAIRRS